MATLLSRAASLVACAAIQVIKTSVRTDAVAVGQPSVAVVRADAADADLIDIAKCRTAATVARVGRCIDADAAAVRERRLTFTSAMATLLRIAARLIACAAIKVIRLSVGAGTVAVRQSDITVVGAVAADAYLVGIAKCRTAAAVARI